MRKYKKLYVDETLKNIELKKHIDELKKQIKEQEIEPYCVDLYFDKLYFNKSGMHIAGEHIENVVKHEVGYNRYPDCRPENWKIIGSDGLVSVFKYDEVKYIIAYRKVEDEQRHKNNMEKY